MLLQTVIGNEVWPTGGTKLFLFACPIHQFPMHGQEVHLWQLAKSGTGRASFPDVSGVGNPRILPAGRGMNPDVVGKWTNQVFDIQEGALLKCMIMRSGRQGNQTSNLLLRVRESAAMRRIAVVPLAGNPSTMDRMVIEGCFDIVDLRQAKDIGYEPPSMYMPTFLQSRWAQKPYIEIRELAPERASPTVVRRQRITNMSGETVEIATSHKRRALDL